MVLFFSLDPLYPAYAAQTERLLGMSPLTDQRLAGVVMMFEQALTLGTCAAVLLLSDDQERRAVPRPSALTPGRGG
jgi:cytochrome c oxidase assembly factor CtaG